jgi:flagellin
MGFSVNFNASASAALTSLNLTNRSLSSVQAHINTGYKIAGAKDNASTFAIAQGMRGDIAGLKAVSDSLSLGQSTVNVALSAAQTISDTLNTIKSKIVAGQAPNVDRAKIQADINSLISTIDSTAQAAQFNGVNLLTSNSSPLAVSASVTRSNATTVTVPTISVSSFNLQTSSGVGSLGISAANVDITGNNSATFAQDNTAAIASGKTFTITVGGVSDVFEFTDGSAALTTKTDATTTAHAVLIGATDSAQAALGKMFTVMRDAGYSVKNNEDGSFVVTSTATITAATTDATGIGNLTGGVFTAGSAALGNDPSQAITNVENAINSVKSALASLGTSANQLQTQGDFVKQLTSTLESGVSTLVDADLAEESANLQALQTKQQLGIQALSIANQQSGAVLSLFR